MSGYSVGRQFSRKGIAGGGLQPQPLPTHSFHSPPAFAPVAASGSFSSSPVPPVSTLRQPQQSPPPPRPQPPVVLQRPATPIVPSFASPPQTGTSTTAAPAGQIMARQVPQPQQQQHQQQYQQPYQQPQRVAQPPAAPRPSPPPPPPQPIARANPFSPSAPHPSQPQPQPYAPAASTIPQHSFSPQQMAAPQQQSLSVAPSPSMPPRQSAWQRQAAAVSHSPAYGAASHGHDAAYGDGSDMAAEEFVQPTAAHRAYTTTAQRRQAPPPALQAQQQQYRPPPIQPSQQPPAAPVPNESIPKRSLLDDDDDLLENLPDELFNLQPSATRIPTLAPVNSAATSAVTRRPVPANMPAQPLPSASGQSGQLTPTKRKADDSNTESTGPSRPFAHAPPHPRPPATAFPHQQQPPSRQPQPDVQFNAHLNALVTATAARPDMAAMAAVKMEDGTAVKQEAGGEYVRLTKKERALLVLGKTKAEEKAVEERARASEEKKRAAEERDKRERAEAELALLRTNLNSLKHETARNAAQSSQHKMAQSQQAEQAKHTMEVNYQSIKVERDMLEMQLNERNTQLRRLQQQLQQQQQLKQQKSEASQAPTPQPATSSPPPSQPLVVVKQQPADMDTTEDPTAAPSAAATTRALPVRSTSSASPLASNAPVASVASNEALIEAFRNLAPSLLGTDQSEGQRVASQLLIVPLDKDNAEASSNSSPLIALLHSLNSYIANQPTAPAHPASQPLTLHSPSHSLALPTTSTTSTFPSVTQHLSHHIRDLEACTSQLQAGTVPPDALLAPTCHLLNLLCNISSVPVDLGLFAATQPPVPSSAAPRRMKAIDDNIVQLLNILLIILRSSPTCRKVAVRGLFSAAAAQSSSAVSVPAVYQHPLYAFRPLKNNSLVRQLSDRAVGSSASAVNAEKEREASEQRLKERAEQPQKQRADTGRLTAAASPALPLNYPDPIPLLFNIVQSFQRINPRSQADLFLLPALGCLLALLDGVVAERVSPSVVGLGGLLDERRLLPLLCRTPGGVQQQVSVTVHCVAVQLFGLLVVDRDALRLVAYRPQMNGPSLLRCLYACLLTDGEREKQFGDGRQKEARARHQLSHDSGDRALSVDKRQEVELSTRQHVVRFMAFVVERYGVDGVQWLSNERGHEETKESVEDETIVVDGERDEHSILTMLVRMMTAEMHEIAASQRAYDPLHAFHSSQPSSASLFRDRRPDTLFPLSQPHPQPPAHQPLSTAARALLLGMRVALVREAMQLTARLIAESLPGSPDSARRTRLLPSAVSQLVQCSHLLLTLLADIRSSSISQLQSMGDEADKLKATLLESRVLSSSREGY